jgi:hypothetical protein
MHDKNASELSKNNKNLTHSLIPQRVVFHPLEQLFARDKESLGERAEVTPNAIVLGMIVNGILKVSVFDLQA